MVMFVTLDRHGFSRSAASLVEKLIYLVARPQTAVFELAILLCQIW